MVEGRALLREERAEQRPSDGSMPVRSRHGQEASEAEHREVKMR